MSWYWNEGRRSRQDPVRERPAVPMEAISERVTHLQVWEERGVGLLDPALCRRPRAALCSPSPHPAQREGPDRSTTGWTNHRQPCCPKPRAFSPCAYRRTRR